jgi:hypothetical protein
MQIFYKLSFYCFISLSSVLQAWQPVSAQKAAPEFFYSTLNMIGPNGADVSIILTTKPIRGIEKHRRVVIYSVLPNGTLSDSMVWIGELNQTALGWELKQVQLQYMGEQLKWLPQPQAIAFRNTPGPLWRGNWIAENENGSRKFLGSLMGHTNATAPSNNESEITGTNEWVRSIGESHDANMRHVNCEGRISTYKLNFIIEPALNPETGSRRAVFYCYPQTPLAGNGYKQVIEIRTELQDDDDERGDTWRFSTPRGREISYIDAFGNRLRYKYSFTVNWDRSNNTFTGRMTGESTSTRGEFVSEGGNWTDLFSNRLSNDELMQQLAKIRENPQNMAEEAISGTGVNNVRLSDTKPRQIIEKGDSVSITIAALNARKNTDLANLSFAGTDSLQIFVYDNATIDGDTISLFVNDQLIKHRQMVSNMPIVFTIQKPENKTTVIRMLAENLGTIPPNTAIMIIRGDQKEERVSMFSDLQTNGTVTILWID